MHSQVAVVKYLCIYAKSTNKQSQLSTLLQLDAPLSLVSKPQKRVPKYFCQSINKHGKNFQFGLPCEIPRYLLQPCEAQPCIVMVPPHKSTADSVSEVALEVWITMKNIAPLKVLRTNIPQLQHLSDLCARSSHREA